MEATVRTTIRNVARVEALACAVACAQESGVPAIERRRFDRKDISVCFRENDVPDVQCPHRATGAVERCVVERAHQVGDHARFVGVFKCRAHVRSVWRRQTENGI
nr:hypothetical protein [Pandoravirus massiliensis]